MESNDPEIMLFLALENIARIKDCAESLEVKVREGLKALQERKPKRKRSKKGEI